MAPSFPLVGFAESCGLHDGVTLKPMTTAIGTIFKNTAPTLLPWWEICPVAWASDSWALGPMGDSASPRLCLPASVSLACSVDTPLLLCRVLIGLRCFELLRWKRLEKQNPIITPTRPGVGAEAGCFHTVPAARTSSFTLLWLPVLERELSRLHLNGTSESIFLTWVIQPPKLSFLCCMIQ